MRRPYWALVVAVLLALPTAAIARRLATPAQRAAVVRGAVGPVYPSKCAVVYLSTVDQTWASMDWIGETGRRVPAGCQKYAANGILIAHLERGGWRPVTAGSAFRCPIGVGRGQPKVPRRVGDDLIPYLHC